MSVFDGLRTDYATITADPPWVYSYSTRKSEIPGTGWHGAQEKYYSTLPMEDIASLPVESIAADNCVLWLWVVNPMLPRCLTIVERWGFEYRGLLTWAKTAKRDPAKPFIGTGYWMRGATEHAVLAVRGKVPKPQMLLPTYFQAPPTTHSTKPEAALRIFEQFSAGPRIELFARTRRPGWDAWGNEVTAVASCHGE